MRANVVLIWLLASTFALSVKSKPHGKHKTPHTANKDKDVLPEEADEGQVLPTFITFEASSQEQEDEEMSSEDSANTHTDKADGVLEEEASERNDKSAPVLLSEEELVDLLKEELKESEEAEEAVQEEESVTEEGESGEEGEKADEEKTQSAEAGGDIIESENAELEERDVEEETSEEEDAKLSDEVEEEEVKEENEKETEKDEERAVGEEEATSVEASVTEGASVTVAEESGVEEEADGSSTTSEIPAADLDYAADSDGSQPLQTEEPKADDDARPLSKTDVADVKAEDQQVTSEKAAPAPAADDYEKDFQNTEASDSGEDVTDQGKDKEGEGGSLDETKTESDFQEPKSSVELAGVARLAGKEDAAKEENSNNDSASHAKGKKRKHKKNQRVRKHHNMQRDEGQQGRGQIQEDTEGRNIDNTVHKAKRRRAGKWATVVGMNPVQIRATVDLYPSARPSLVGGIHRPEAPADPCDNFRCKRGKTCKLDGNNKPSCVCRQPSECPPSVNEFDNVCGTDNNTYDTSCELFATKCNLEGTKKGHRLHLDYTGPCKFIAPCLDTELVQFPLRMRDWLKNVLLQLYEHDSMSPGFLTSKQRVRVRKIYESERRLHAGDHTLELLAQDFEKNYHMYIYPVHWQFAQIDQHPSDRFLSHSELAPLRVPLVPMEHCTSRFFQECDADKDKQVSFKEWTQCFGIKDEDMDVNLLF